MIKINLLAEKKKTKSKSKVTAVAVAGQGLSMGQTLVLALILLAGVAVAGGWWWSLSDQIANWKVKHEQADRELERLAEVRKKGDEYKKQKDLLARKIELITELKRRQDVPVHILDQVSRNLPDFVWLDQMTANRNQITITGQATTYQAVTNFYNNLTRSGLFTNVNLGRTFEAKEGVSFSLTCGFAIEPEPELDAESKSRNKNQAPAKKGGKS